VAEQPSLLIVGHGSRSAVGVAEYWDLAKAVADTAPELDVGCGFIELAAPDLDAAVDRLVDRGARSVVAVPLVLLGAGHMKDDGPAALHRGRHRHPAVRFAYGRHLGVHPLVLAVAEDRIRAAIGDADPAETAVVLVSRGSSDPDANADLYKVTRLLWDSRGLAMVEPAFVSLAQPSVPAALERCRLLGAIRVVVVPYFLFTGILVDRINDQVAEWGRSHPEVDARPGPHLGADPRVAELVLARYREALAGDAHMNCDLCVYRHALPGYEHKHQHDHLPDHPKPEEVIHIGNHHSST